MRPCGRAGPKRSSLPPRLLATAAFVAAAGIAACGRKPAPAASDLGGTGAPGVGDGGPAESPAPPAAAGPTPVTVAPGESLALFDGETLAGWRVTEEEDFVLHGAVRVEDGSLVLREGRPFTGVTWAGEFPREGYEIELEARRLSGQDIFCGVTMPVGDSHVTFVMGGWSNNVVGLSNVDGFNASENEAMRVIRFENDRWYRVRLRVTAPKIEAWIDGEQVIDLERADHAFTTYTELEPHRPAGIFSWRTKAAIRSVRMKRLP